MSRHPDGHPRRRGVRAALGMLALGFAPAIASGQTLGPDPYQPFNSFYKPYVYPSAPPSGSIPNMGRLDYLGSAPSPSRSFAGYLESMGIGTPNPFAQPRGNVSRFTPYYRSYRQFDKEFQRGVGPSTPDEFHKDQEDRHRRYIEALRERDPKKRQVLLKKIEAENRAAIRASDDPNRFRTYRESREEAPKAGAGGAAAPTAGGNAASNRNRTGTPTSDEIDALPDPGPLPPDPNQPSRRPTAPAAPLELRSLQRSGSSAVSGDPNPARVLERSRRSGASRIRRSMEDPPALPGEAETRPGMAPTVGPAATPGQPTPEPADLPPGNLLDEPVPPR